mmetsp:Transcript_88017/g.222169  ORF Transcript_88017/g.222169 Transcript_88017/m.222169 type:complete len:255 (+) Transcript_88017:533-1297(+)
MAASAAASQARCDVLGVLHTVCGGITINDPRLGEGIVALLLQLLDGLEHVPPGGARARGREHAGVDFALLAVQERLDARHLHRLGKLEGALVDRLLDTDEVDALPILWDAVLLCVEHLMVDVVGVEVLETLEDVFEVLAPLDPHETRDILKHEDPWLCLFNILSDLEEDRSSALLVAEALLQARAGEGLAREARHVEVRLGRGGVVPFREVIIPDLGREIGHDSRFDVLVDIAREEVVDLDTQVPQGHYRRLHP